MQAPKVAVVKLLLRDHIEPGGIVEAVGEGVAVRVAVAVAVDVEEGVAVIVGSAIDILAAPDVHTPS